MSRVTAVAMQKGGVGKTTTAINLATGLALGDHDTLLVDLDPQANATHGVGIDAGTAHTTVYELLFEGAAWEEVRRPTDIAGLSLCPASLDLNGARAELPRNQSDYTELSRAIDAARHEFDWTLIDCPPSLGPLTLNALKAADDVLIPLQCEYYALEGLSQLWNTINRIQSDFNPSLTCLGIVLTMYDSVTNLSDEVRAEAHNYFEDHVLDTVIPRNVRISEAPGFGKPVIMHEPMCRGSNAYLNLTEEVIVRERQRLRKGA